MKSPRIVRTESDSSDFHELRQEFIPPNLIPYPAESIPRLFDELVKCDTNGVLKEVRKSVEGKE